MKQTKNDKVTDGELAHLHRALIATLDQSRFVPHFKMLVVAQVLTYACLAAGLRDKDEMMRVLSLTIDVLCEEAQKAYDQLN